MAKISARGARQLASVTTERTMRGHNYCRECFRSVDDGADCADHPSAPIGRSADEVIVDRFTLCSDGRILVRLVSITKADGTDRITGGSYSIFARVKAEVMAQLEARTYTVHDVPRTAEDVLARIVERRGYRVLTSEGAK